MKICTTPGCNRLVSKPGYSLCYEHWKTKNSKTSVTSENAPKPSIRTAIQQNVVPNRGRQAGQNIRELALRRRTNAVMSFITAWLIILIPLPLVKASEKFLSQITSSDSSQKNLSLGILLIAYLICIITALGLVTNGVSLWKRANNADQGARGEEDASKELSRLKYEGWQIEYGMRLGNGLGDADVVCISPKNKAYVIDVKSHRGEVVVDGEQIYRRKGKKIILLRRISLLK